MAQINNIDIVRGDIFYVYQGFAVGAEMKKGRPAVVVSNDLINRGEIPLEVVFLTSQEKKDYPTRVRVITRDGQSTALCEQISTVDRTRLGARMGKVTSEEMAAIDRAMAFSLGIGHDEVYGTNKVVGGGRTKVEIELETYKKLYDKLLAAIEKGGYKLGQ